MAVTDGIDLWDMDAFQRQEHHDMLERLRETDPGIHWIDEGDRGPEFVDCIRSVPLGHRTAAALR